MRGSQLRELMNAFVEVMQQYKVLREVFGVT
jgi:hypothetical protein